MRNVNRISNKSFLAQMVSFILTMRNVNSKYCGIGSSVQSRFILTMRNVNEFEVVDEVDESNVLY